MKKLSVLLVLFILPCYFLFSSCDKKSERTTYEITCELEGNILKGKETVCFYNSTENAFNSLKFNLFSNAFRCDATYSPISEQYKHKAYYSGESFGGIIIDSVLDEKGGALTFNITGKDKNILEVILTEEVFPEEVAVVVIDYTITLANVIARTGINSKTINLANFYPILCGIENGAFYECVYFSSGDPYFSDVSNYLVNFTYDEKYVVASSGNVKKSESKNGKVTTLYTLDGARDFALVLSTDFEYLTRDINGIEINYYFYDDNSPEKSINYAVESMEYFIKTFGNYPYKKYSVVQTEFVQGGMEFPALVMISDDLEEMAYGEVIVHETAHQWWQTTVGNNEVEYGFLDEGLAEYSVVLFYENHPNYGVKRETLITSSEKTFKTFCTVYDKLFSKVDTSMLRSLDKFSSEYEYVNIAYIKPTIMYDNLRKTIGEEKFFSALKNYYKAYYLKNSKPDYLVAEFEKQVKDTSGYFYSFFDGKAII